MIIAVWGNSGSGKSTIAIKLANAFSRKKKNVILIDADYIAPQTNVWYPKMEIRSEASLRVILDNAVTVENVAGKLNMVRGRENFGVLGYGKGYAANMVTDRKDTAAELLDACQSICDVVIVDCQSNMLNDILTFTSLEKADERVIVLTPDVKALSWYESNVRPMEDAWSNSKLDTVRVFNKVTRKTPAEAIESVIGTAGFFLPYAPHLEEELYSGELSGDGIYSHSRYFANVIEGLVQRLLENDAKAREVIITSKEG